MTGIGIGSAQVSAIHLGDAAISEVHVGTDLAWQSEVAFDADVVIVPFACNTSTGNQTIAKSGWTRTPGAVLFFVSGATANSSTPTDTAILSVGFTDGTTNNCVGARWGHGAATSVNDRSGSQSACIVIAADGGTNGQAAFSSFGSGSVTINWSAAPSAARRGVAVMIASDIVSSKTIDHFDPVLGANDRILGFDPSVAVLLHNGAASWQNAVDARIGFGLWTAAGQGAVGMFGDDGDPTEDAGIEISRNHCSVRRWLSSAAGALAGGPIINGIRLTGSSISNDHEVGLLALRLKNGVKVVAAPPIPASGDWQETTLGFKPQAGIIVQTLCPEVGTAYTAGEPHTVSLSLGFFDHNSEATLGIQIEDGADTTNTSSLARIDRVQDLRNNAANVAGEMAGVIRSASSPYLRVPASSINYGTGSGQGFILAFS